MDVKTPKPLAERMRPQQLEDFVGQEHLVGEGQVLWRAVREGQLFSLILWGPPGSGKTTLARILARAVGRPFIALSATDAGVREVRQAIEQARRAGQAVVFIDEIHRFNKSQQDALLAAIEKGTILLIGATTENPSLEVIAPLLSRCQIYRMEPLQEHHLLELLRRAIERDEVLHRRPIHLMETHALLRLSGGDARRLLNLLEQVTLTYPHGALEITDELVTRVAQQRILPHDKAGEQHYDLISAFIKSVRGSDPNAAVYWLARMIAGGEDPLFICRRLIILAAEDIGNADPSALPLAVACQQALERIGMPEGRIVLAQTAIYLACAPKSNSSYLAIDMALEAVERTGQLPVPLSLRNAVTELMRDWGYGSGYRYDHDAEDHFAGQEFMPHGLQGRRFYEPGDNDREQELRRRLQQRWKDKYSY